jgi:hypothetical protein
VPSSELNDGSKQGNKRDTLVLRRSQATRKTSDLDMSKLTSSLGRPQTHTHTHTHTHRGIES